jgi:hypothetical protein
LLLFLADVAASLVEGDRETETDTERERGERGEREVVGGGDGLYSPANPGAPRSSLMMIRARYRSSCPDVAASLKERKAADNS